MATKTILNIKTDTELKQKAQQTAEELGLPLSVVVNNYLRQFIKERRVIFDTALTPNQETAKRLDIIMKDLQNNKNMIGPFDSTEDFFASLDS